MVKRLGPSETELEAASAVARLLGGDATFCDVPSAPNGTHDFNLNLAGGDTVALEVTSLTVQNFKAMEAAIGERTWLEAGLQFHWSPSIIMASRTSKGPDIRILRASLSEVFKSLENRFESSLSTLTSTDLIGNGEFLKWTPIDRDLLSLYKMGVRHLNAVVPYDGKGRISIGYVGVPENREINDLLGPVVRVNLDKLRRAPALQRHLFVWVDKSDWESESKMFLYDLPKSILSMPGSLDVVWLGLWSPKFKPWSNVGALWKANSGGHWSDVTPELWRIG